MGAKAQLRRDLIQAQQQRDRALAALERAQRENTALRDRLAAIDSPAPTMSERLVDWVADLDQRIRQAVGL